MASNAITFKYNADANGNYLDVNGNFRIFACTLYSDGLGNKVYAEPEIDMVPGATTTAQNQAVVDAVVAYGTANGFADLNAARVTAVKFA